MQLLNPAVNRYVLPITDEYDDDHLIKDIINEILFLFIMANLIDFF